MKYRLRIEINGDSWRARSDFAEHEGVAYAKRDLLLLALKSAKFAITNTGERLASNGEAIGYVEVFVDEVEE